MISFTPPIKVSLLVAFIHLIGVQFFLQSNSYVWLLPANILFGVTAALYILYLNKTDASLTMERLAVKGIKLSLLSSLLCIGTVVISILFSVYLIPETLLKYPLFKTGKGLFTFIFTNGFLVNTVCGSVAAFITAGILNERKHHYAGGHLPSVNTK